MIFASPFEKKVIFILTFASATPRLGNPDAGYMAEVLNYFCLRATEGIDI